jgi:hypothetical protein
MLKADIAKEIVRFQSEEGHGRMPRAVFLGESDYGTFEYEMKDLEKTHAGGWSVLGIPVFCGLQVVVRPIPITLGV